MINASIPSWGTMGKPVILNYGGGGINENTVTGGATVPVVVGYGGPVPVTDLSPPSPPATQGQQPGSGYGRWQRILELFVAALGQQQPAAAPDQLTANPQLGTTYNTPTYGSSGLTTSPQLNASLMRSGIGLPPGIKT